MKISIDLAGIIASILLGIWTFYAPFPWYFKILGWVWFLGQQK